jgi:cobalt-zinc-cadmium efflux system membrane fusion protein
MPVYVVLLVVFVTLGCGRANEEPAAAPSPPPASGPAHAVVLGADSPHLRQIRVEPVRAADVAAEDLTAPGRVMINPNRAAKVLLPVAGRVVDVLARLGDAVDQGQGVVVLESPDADAAIAAYRQSVAADAQAEAAQRKAQADYERIRDLYEGRAAAQKDLLAAQNDLAQATAAVATAGAAREQARRKLELLGLNASDLRQRILVRAPIRGKVLEISVAPGEYRTDLSAPLMTIADLSTVWMSAEVPESGIRLIHPGDRLTIALIAYPDETFTGRVTRIADVLDPQTRTVRVYVEMPNPQGRLRPEMFGTIRHAGAVGSRPVVPLSALVQHFGRTIVFVEVQPGQFERREVTVGTRTGDAVPVTQGLQAGERIVVQGVMLLKDL